eukprot:Skav227633  [mRNA]  locus=scaffold3692:113888:115465:- [translate_table: standard]
MAPFALSKFLDDPLLGLIIRMACQLRRLMSIDAPRARQFLDLACQDQASSSFGPAGSFRKYLDSVGLHLTAEGTLICAPFLRCNLLVDSSKCIKETLRSWWPRFMVNHIERKGIGEVHLHPRQSAKCFASLTATEQKLLLHNMLGAFQSEAIKAKWDSHSDATCPLCQEVDSRTHRVLHCPALLEVRQTFPEAIQIISDQRQDWVYFPLAQAYPHQHVLETLLNLIPPTDVPEPVDISREVVSFFTDGGALHTTDSIARIAGFSVVQDIGTSERAFQQTADYAFSSPPRFPSFKTLCTGIVPGRQNVPRAELYAFTLALQASERCAMASSIRFVTDAKYVCDIIKKIQSQDSSLNGPSVANADLVSVIREHWNPERHHIVKIKSHRSFSSAVDIEDLFLILGNHCADVAVSAALQAIPSILKEAAQACVDHHALEQSMLTKVMQYLLALNRKRTFLLKQPSSIPGLPAPLPPEPPSLMPKHLFGLDAISFLSQYAPSDYIPWVSDPIPHEDVLQACQQGTRLHMR